MTALKNIHHLAFLNFSRENLLAEKLVGSFFTSDINMNKIMKRINNALFIPVLSSIKNNNTTLWAQGKQIKVLFFLCLWCMSCYFELRHNTLTRAFVFSLHICAHVYIAGKKQPSKFFKNCISILKTFIREVVNAFTRL